MTNKPSRSFLLRNFKWISCSLSIVSILFVYFIPRAIMYSNHLIVGWIVFGIIFFIIPVLVLVTLWTFTRRSYLSIGVSAASVLIIGPTFGLLQGHRENVELNKYGTCTNAIVETRKQVSEHGGGSMHWAVQCKYIVNGRIYETAFHNDMENIHPVGDTIKIIYSCKFPKIYSLINEWKK